MQLSLERTAWTGLPSGSPRPVYPPGGLGARRGVSTGRPPGSWPYLHLLEVAHALGHADGGLAASIEPAGPVGPQPTSCRGRDPEEFARLLWADRPGAPPSGLRLNAPLWYADGFAEGLAAERLRPSRREWCGPVPRPAASSEEDGLPPQPCA